ncbi:MAG: alpha/beta fold hydrolase [Defluviitaleaceae bacterium]|nr:alpha/beta fold hydrolase [Defluviitaleaceae bacterium]
MRKFLSVMLILVLAFGIFAPAPLNATATEVRIVIDDKEIDFSQHFQGPVIVDGRTLVPVETLYLPNVLVALNEIETIIISGIEMVPIRTLFESLGYKVDWDGATMTVTITTSSVTIPAETVATSFMNYLAAGDTTTANLMLPTDLGAFEFATIILLQKGSLLDFAIVDASDAYGVTLFNITATHTMGNAAYMVAVDAAGAIVGFASTYFAFETLPTPEDALYFAEAIVVGEGGKWPLDGILTMPHQASAQNPVPAVILVHGSGPQNMDTSIFDNRVFHDIADYLSSNGIAVLRYNKRTFSHGERLMEAYGLDFTVWEESIEDALFAAEMLRADPRISNVFVAGHSLGAMLAPRIAEEGGLDGTIMLAGSPRSLYEVQYDQNVQLINDLLAAGLIPQETADENLAMVAEMLEEARNIGDLSMDELRDRLIFGIPGLWQQSVVNSLPLPFITRSTTPVFIVHGDRDWQVFTDVDFQVMADYTHDMPHVTAKLFDNVNHLLMQSQTPYNDIRDYMVRGNVDRQLLRDMVEWILAQ